MSLLYKIVEVLPCVLVQLKCVQLMTLALTALKTSREQRASILRPVVGMIFACVMFIGYGAVLYELPATITVDEVYVNLVMSVAFTAWLFL